MKKEFRNFDLGNLHLRNTEGEGEESRIIEGTAIVFGKRSVNMTPWSESREMYEVIEPSAISQELLNRCDIVLTYEHNFERVLGASVKGEGTLKLTRTDKGVDISCRLGNSTDANDAHDRVERGDVQHMSFAMVVDLYAEGKVSYEKLSEKSATGKDVWIRHINEVEDIFDVTICHRPAYQDTSVDLRSEQEAIDKFLDSVELEKRSDGGGEDPEEEKRKQQEAFEMEQAQLRHQLFMMQLGY